MAQAATIRPDAGFIRSVMASGGEDLKKCYQCATCSVVCDLAPDGAPFPRRQMLAAQWGLKDKLAGDPALWLCHQCGHCTDYCPRGARPGDVMGALRREITKEYAFPRFMGRLVSEPAALPLLFLLPVLVFTALLLWGPRGAPTPLPEFANLFPIPVIETVFFALSGFAVLAFAVGISRQARAYHAAGAGGILRGVMPAITEALVNDRSEDCELECRWRRGHQLTLWSFLALAITGTLVGVGTLAGVMHTPLPLGSFLKMLANVAALGLLAGTGLLLWCRISGPGTKRQAGWFDWFFLGTLSLVALTGVLAEVARLAQVRELMYAVYFVHLVLIFALFLYAPYSKFAHIAYRTVAVATSEPRVRRHPRKPENLVETDL